MIDQTLEQLLNTFGHHVFADIQKRGSIKYKDITEALTAIYEIGLGVIGKDEKPSRDITPDREGKIFEKDGKLWKQEVKPKRTIVHSESEKARNTLRASQRSAWAKACGVDNG